MENPLQFLQPGEIDIAGLVELDLLELAPAWDGEELAEEAKRDKVEEYKEYLRQRTTAEQEFRREREEAEISGTLSADAEAFRDLKLKPKLAEAHDFTPKVKTPIVQGLFFRDTLAWVAGSSGTFKSFITADLAFRYGSDGMDYHGRRMTNGRALLVIAEGAAGYADRKTAWERQHDREVKNVVIYPAPLQLGDTLKEMPALISYLREEEDAGRPFGLVVFDTQAMCTVGIEENGSEMNLVINVLHRIREVSGACVLTVHHFGKDKRAGMRGSSMIYAAADTVLVVKRGDDELDVTLSTSQADEGKQKDGITEKDFLVLDMRVHTVGEDYFGDPVSSLVPVAGEAHSTNVQTVDEELPDSLPWLTEQQMAHLKLAAFYEHRGGTPADMAARQEELSGAPVKNARQNIRNRMIELSKMTPPLVEQKTAKGPWTITPGGVAVIARQLAVGDGWVERAGRRRRSSGAPGEDQTMIENPD